MVCAEMEKVSDFLELPIEQQNVLRLAARAHDIGKAVTTALGEDGRLHAYGHGRIGASMLRSNWWSLGYRLSPEVRNLVASLVRYHARPLHPRVSLEAHAAATSCSVSCRLVAILAEADIRGRIMAPGELEGALLSIDLFREAARELGCFETPYVWPNSHARWKFFQAGGKDLSYSAYDDRRFAVHMTFGLPGAGKSAYTRSLGLPIVSRDDVRQEHKFDPTKKRDQGKATQEFQEALRVQLREGNECIVDGTNLLRSLRANTIDMCVNYGASVVFHVFDRDRDSILRNNLDRKRVVPESVIERMAERMEFPDITECHSVVCH